MSLATTYRAFRKVGLEVAGKGLLEKRFLKLVEGDERPINLLGAGFFQAETLPLSES